jgi:hypothetical protein
MEAFRSDHLDKPGWITDQVFEEIYTSDVCIADLTFGNPNVFYELGVAQTANRPVITLIEKGQVIPFDMRDFRCIEYDLEISSFQDRKYIEKVVRYIHEYEADNWEVKDIFLAYKKVIPAEDFSLQLLRNRSSLYEKAIDMINRACNVYDTTWGKPPRKLNPVEEKQRQKYRAATDAAIQRGVMYKDLFSKNIKCEDEVAKLMDQYRDYPNYEAKCVDGIGADLPVIDMLITDNNEVLLSHVSFNGAAPMPMYVYIQSETMAEFYAGLYNDCWQFSRQPLTLPT